MSFGRLRGNIGKWNFDHRKMEVQQLFLNSAFGLLVKVVRIISCCMGSISCCLILRQKVGTDRKIVYADIILWLETLVFVFKT